MIDICQNHGCRLLILNNLAERYTQPPPAALMITHGLSGSGKTWLSQQLLESLGAIRVRSDVERKRLHALAPDARSGSGIDSGIYSSDASQRTYARLAELATMILRAGYSVIVDAAFLQRVQRDQLRAVAEQVRALFIILDMQTPESTLPARLRQRQQQRIEASEADLTVLQHQLTTREPLSGDEQGQALTIDGTKPILIVELERQLQARFASA